MKRSVNQHIPKPSSEELVKDLLKHRVKKVPDAAGVFICFKPVGTGVSYNPAGYARINKDGGKIVAHKLVYLEKTKKEEEDIIGDISHLCGNAFCCNPAHLHEESRDDNISRRGCIGYTRIEQQWITTCGHYPKCKVARIGEATAAPVSETDASE